MRIGYMTSEYPARSHTFIRREIEQLEQCGVKVFRYSQRKMSLSAALTDSDRDEIEHTRSIFPLRLLEVIAAHGASLKVAPGQYFRTLLWLCSKRPPGGLGFLYVLVYFFQGIYFANKMRSDNISQLHIHFVNSGVYVGSVAAKFLQIPWSASVHGRSDFDFPGIHALAWIIQEAAFLRCISQFGASQAMRQTTPNNWGKIIVAYCGLPEEIINHNARNTTPATRKKILNVGRLSPEKGQFLLLEMAALLKDKGHSFELILVGDGPDRQRLEQAAQQKGIADICLFRGAIDEQAVLQEMIAADVFVCPSLMEGLPQVLMEAMAVELPTVAPYLSGIPELIDNELTGLLFPVGDCQKMTDAVERLFNDEDLLIKICVNARDKVSSEFLLANNIKPLCERFCLVSVE
jgi:glycosyltransferase involved in cell wall biosynthesis